LNRRVPKSEIAQRVSHFDNSHLQRVAMNWFYDKEVSAVAWGPTHSLSQFSHYNRPLRRSTLGWYGNTHYLVN